MRVHACTHTNTHASQRSPLSCRDCRAAPPRVNANRNANESAPINACLISYSAASGRGKAMEVEGTPGAVRDCWVEFMRKCRPNL